MDAALLVVRMGAVLVALGGCAVESSPSKDRVGESNKPDDDAGVMATEDSSSPITDALPSADGSVIGVTSDVDASAGTCRTRAADGSVLLIDDFEADDLLLPEGAERGGRWFFYDDGTAGEQTVSHETDGASALRVVSSAFTTWGSGFGVQLSPDSTPAQVCPYDASSYAGIQFRARGEGQVRIRLAMPENTPVTDGGECTKPGEECYDWPGAWLRLSQEWATYSFSFCQLTPEMWAGAAPELDPAKLVAIHFLLKGSVDLRLDQVEFMPGQLEPTGECVPSCPFDSAPASTLAPDETWLELSESLTLNTFQQETTRCGPLTRRYLSYAPASLGAESDAPVVMALHGSGGNAESFQELMARGHLDELAERDGFVVVYGNAAPGPYSEPDVPNSGAWRQSYADDGEVNDKDYLLQVLDDLTARGITSGNNPVFLMGLSNGGGMVLEAAKALPGRFAGIAPFMAYEGSVPSPIPNLDETSITRVFFGYAPDDPGLPVNYVQDVLSEQPAAWARALGISQEAIDAPEVTELPDVAVEGEDYAGDAAPALATRDSRATRIDFVDAAPDSRVAARVRVLVFERGGHFWPNPIQDTESWILERWGFRNQDVDASEAVWDFFRESLVAPGDAGR